MTNKERMIELRAQGWYYSDIAKELGLSRQYVGFVLGKAAPNGGFRPYKQEECIYDGLRFWLNENRITRRELCRRLEKKANHGGSVTNVLDHLRGKGSFTINDINKLIETTGMTYEQLFLSQKGEDN